MKDVSDENGWDRRVEKRMKKKKKKRERMEMFIINREQQKPPGSSGGKRHVCTRPMTGGIQGKQGKTGWNSCMV